MAAFVDQARIEVRAGRGGDGASHFRREKFVPRGGPDGGEGGRGGDVVLLADENLHTLLDFQFQSRYHADDGGGGEGNERHGANGADIVVKVPLGTLVYDDETGRLVADLSEQGQQYLACRGGRGGRGNASYATSTHRAPILRELGEPGQEATLRLELKLLADAALVGFPNVGKSTLIARLSAARPKIADYPFTTLEPNLGVVRLDHEASFVIADLPGLIEGAAAGRGLGHEFLRHLERARAIVHVLDLSGIERADPVSDYRIIRGELAAYEPYLAALPELVVANKMDLPEARELLEIVAEELAKEGVSEILAVSAVTGEGLAELRSAVAKMVFESEVESVVAVRAEAGPVEQEPASEAEPFTIDCDDEGVYVVAGQQVDVAVAMCDLDNEEAILHLHRKLVRLGVIDALRAAGCGEGDVVRIGDVILDFEE